MANGAAAMGRKLGLSRMNMGGAGAKMIRAVMKSKGVATFLGSGEQLNMSLFI